MTASEILQAYKLEKWGQEQLKKLIDDFRDKARNLIVMNPRTPTIDTILEEAEKVKALTGEAPILVIDYLQLLQGNPKQDAQTIIKEASKKLKDYVICNDTLCFIMTAYNRDSTKARGKATIESGRDTSDIEYSSDYILSINFTEYENENSQADIEELKKGYGETGKRYMTIKVLKNRLGTTGDKINYDFIPMYNVFEEKDYFKPVKPKTYNNIL